MANRRVPNQRKEYNAHYSRIERYAALITAIYEQFNKKFVRLAISANHNPLETFNFSDYPELRSKVSLLQREMARDIQALVVNGVTAEWNESNFKNDKLAKGVIGYRYAGVEAKKIAKYSSYFNNNNDALKAFLGRKSRDFNLSDRIWNLTAQYKDNIEQALSIGLSDGRSASELSRDIRMYLNEPDKLFRRIRDSDGNLKLSSKAKDYKPGVGKYRSSYKNAMRVTRTEINMSYRESDHLRWGQMDFIVGFEVKRSGRAFDCDICQSFAGKYPKTFKFVSWHPNCRCYVIPVLMTDDEFWNSNERLLDGEDILEESSKQVNDVPQGFTDWVKDNQERARKSKSAPYWVQDNFAKGDMSNRLNYNK